MRRLLQTLLERGLFSAEPQFTLGQGNAPSCQGMLGHDGSSRFLSSSDKQGGLESMLPVFGELPVFGGKLPVFGGELAFT